MADTLSPAAQLIAGFEGYRSSPYWDVNAYRAGYGSDTVTMPDGSIVPISQGMTVNRADAARDLDRRINSEFAPSAARAVGQDAYNALSPNQQAVLTSLAYNYGAGAWDKGLRNVAAAVQTPGYADDAAAIRALGSHNDGINERRRNEEAAIYAGDATFNPDYDPSLGYTPASQGMDAQGRQANALAPSGLLDIRRREALMRAAQASSAPTQMQTVETTNALAPVAQFYGGWLNG